MDAVTLRLEKRFEFGVRFNTGKSTVAASPVCEMVDRVTMPVKPFRELT